MGLKERIFAFDDTQARVVEVPFWDNVKLEVRSLTGKERAMFLQRFVSKDGSRRIDLERFYPDLIIATVFDPETGERVFEPGDAHLLNEKSGAALEFIAEIAVQLSGLKEGAVDEAGKGSSSILSEGSTSD